MLLPITRITAEPSPSLSALGSVEKLFCGTSPWVPKRLGITARGNRMFTPHFTDSEAWTEGLNCPGPHYTVVHAGGGFFFL